jgi:hypothetical protein
MRQTEEKKWKKEIFVTLKKIPKRNEILKFDMWRPRKIFFSSSHVAYKKHPKISKFKLLFL